MSSSFLPPPIRHQLTTRVSQSRALDLISAYLDATKPTTDIPSTNTVTSPHSPSQPSSTSVHPTLKGAALHPNAVLTEAGPVAPTGGVAGLVLRNLERVRAGLKGEIWAAEPGERGVDEVGDEEVVRSPGGEEVVRYPGGEVEIERGEGEVGAVAGWQEKEEFERQQGPEVFGRDEDVTGKGMPPGKGVPRVKATPARIWDGAELLREEGMDARLDKNARKKMKKERRLHDRRVEETGRRKEAASRR